MITLVMPWPSPKLSPNARVHWAVLAREKKAYRQACGWQAKAQGALPIKANKLEVAFTFYPPTKRRIDLDNCIASIKSGIDGIADVIGVDDSKWRMAFEMAPHIGGMIKVTIKKI